MLVRLRLLCSLRLAPALCFHREIRLSFLLPWDLLSRQHRQRSSDRTTEAGSQWEACLIQRLYLFWNKINGCSMLIFLSKSHKHPVWSPVSLLLSVRSYLGLRPGSAGITGKLPLLPGHDPLAVRGPLSHRVGQVRHRLPRIFPHLKRHPSLGKTSILWFIDLENVFFNHVCVSRHYIFPDF